MVLSGIVGTRISFLLLFFSPGRRQKEKEEGLGATDDLGAELAHHSERGHLVEIVGSTSLLLHTEVSVHSTLTYMGAYEFVCIYSLT